MCIYYNIHIYIYIIVYNMFVYVYIYIYEYILYTLYLIYLRTRLSRAERSSESKATPALSRAPSSISHPLRCSPLAAESSRARIRFVCVHKSFRLTNKPCIFASKLLFTHVNGTSIKDTRNPPYSDPTHIYIYIRTVCIYLGKYTPLIYVL